MLRPLKYLFRIVDISCPDPDEERRKWLLNMMLAGTVLGAVIMLGVVLLDIGFLDTGSSREDVVRIVIGGGVTIVGAVVLYILNRRVRSEVTGTIFVLLITGMVVVADTPQHVVGGRSLIIFTIPILSASVLVRPWASFAAATLSSTVVAFISRFVLQEEIPNLSAILAFYLLAIPAWMSARHLELALHRERKNLKRSERLAGHLRAIRRVNQLIIRVKDRDRLLDGVCEALIQVESHRCAWAVAFDDDGEVASVGTAGLSDGAASLLKDGALPPCGREALSGTGLVMTEDAAGCSGCSVGPDREARGALTARLENSKQVYGLLAVHTGVALDADEEIKALFREVAGDLGFALATMRLAERQKQTQAELLHQERLAAIGRLGAGIAHDFRNQLATVLLYAQVNAAKPDLPQDVKNELNIIVEETRKANDLVRRILDFSSTGAIERQPMDLPDFIGDVLDVLRRTIPENVRISWKRELCDGAAVVGEPQGAALTVRADARRMQQMVTNLALNARDAMPEGGELHFSVSRREVKTGDEPPVEGMEAGSWVELTVSDTGMGMTQEVQEHLFEPFFTTKEEEGTGLGLAQVYGIVRQHEGVIDVESNSGQGTTFRVYLPAYDAPIEDTREQSAGAKSPGGQGETILLVEDSERLREATRITLESHGYRVLTARDGRKALRLYHTHAVDLVVSDVVMPHIGGKKLMTELIRLDPNVRAVGMTGYALDDVKALKAVGFLRIIPKPIESARLLRAIRQVLG